MNRRVVITGMGAITPFGNGALTCWQAVKEGKSGISLIERVDVSDLPVKVAGEIKNFNPNEFIDKKEVKRMDRFSQYALAAAQLAIEESGLDFQAINTERAGILIGSGVGGIETIENQYHVLSEKGAGRISAFFVPMMISNIASSLIAMRYGIKGFTECVVTACASASNAIGDAYKMIQRNEADIMIAGGAEAPITKLSLAGFCANKTLSKNEDPASASKPFDAERNGFVMGEGSGILVLEEMEHAIKRGANIIAEVVGYGCTNDAYHITSVPEDGEGAARCMRLALENAGIKAEDIGYINAHGTSTVVNDKSETAAVKSVFGEYAYRLPVSSTKSMTGHLLGASGAIEAIIIAYAVKEKFLPPTINYTTPDPECDLYYIPNQGISADIMYAMSNSFGFGGHNATLILKAVE
ncbi:beta-ketoacyl-ACP synthase II [Clostridium aminobutyricum]|uniref:3-oxoacyl-[acyl-carrier-protein] synthase 2 n=1 Tax=Clostridium aminobutyricum TaxID=33953 RepID=A0A939D8N0_CLOAM|nr:beta-ketoacyl-ACP synthase II [Clostridium aminobutyricum]MBN7773499.1 beta-ketoacyl-ACP synthase II [Clostridium aminobutyricum]